MLKSFALASLLVVAPFGAAHATDLLSVPVSSRAAALPVAGDSGFDWNGFYAGVYGVGQFSAVGGSQYGAGVDVGANAQFDFVLVGAEVAVHGLVGGPTDTAYGQVIGKAGLVFTDNFVGYAAAGYGINLGAAAESDALVGGGLELALTDGVSLNAQYLHGFPITGANPKDQVTLGANFHF